MIDSIYLNAIIEANKMGAKGWQVIGATMPKSAMENYRIKLVIMKPYPRGASQKCWFEE